jgi:ferrous iron transport protein A
MLTCYFQDSLAYAYLYKGGINMPLTMAKTGEKVLIKKINGKEETVRFLKSLGFIVGESVTLISELSGNLIINVKDSRIAIDKSMANRIII